MTVCDACGQETTTAVDSCVERPNIRRYGAEFGEFEDGSAPERCGSCRVAVGGVHHVDCGVAYCPRCDMERWACGCDAAGGPR